MIRFILFALLGGVVAGPALAYEQSPLLARTYAKLQQIARGEVVQVNIGIVGDSVANNKPRVIRPWFEAAFPKTTEGILTYVLEGNSTVSRGTSALPWDNSFSWTGECFTLDSESGIWFSNGGGWIGANRIAIYYETGPTLGRFKIQRAVGWGNSTWVDEAGYEDVNTASASRGWGKIGLTVPLQSMRLRLVHVGGGPVRFPMRPVFRNTAMAGVCFRSLDRGGLGLPDAVSGDRAILVDYLRELDLDLAFFEMKENPNTFSTDLGNMRDIFDEAKATTEWIFVGSSPLAPVQDPSGTKQISENAQLQAHAASRGGYYFDGYALIGDYANMEANNWHGDGIHESASCSRYLSDELWKDLGYLIAPWITAVVSEGDPGDPVDFGYVDFGTSPTRAITVTNTGTVGVKNLTANWSGVGFTGAFSGNGTLAAGASTTYTANVPVGPEGPKVDALTITGASAVSLNGTTSGMVLPNPITANATRLTALETWRRQQFSTVENAGAAANGADPDGDGAQNLLEFATLCDPQLANPEGLGTTTIHDGKLVYSYRRSRQALADGWVFAVKWGADLDGVWSSEGITEAVSNQTPTTEQVTAEVPLALGAQFIRLYLSRP